MQSHWHVLRKYVSCSLGFFRLSAIFFVRFHCFRLVWLFVVVVRFGHFRLIWNATVLKYSSSSVYFRSNEIMRWFFSRTCVPKQIHVGVVLVITNTIKTVKIKDHIDQQTLNVYLVYNHSWTSLTQNLTNS